MLHTPRLCIDTRFSPLWGQAGHEVGEFVDELAAYHGEEENPWVNRHRTVLLSNKGQIFAGPWKRYDTRVRPTGWAFPHFWERRFVDRAPVSFVHRFRPFGFAAEKLSKPTLTTWLPSHRIPLHAKIRGGAWEQHVVPSVADKDWLVANSADINPNSIHVVTPGPRRFLFFDETPRDPNPHLAIVITNGRASSLHLGKAMEQWRARRPGRDILYISLDDMKTTGPRSWTLLLSRAELFVYDVARPLDAAMLAWEAISREIPTLFRARHRVLTEWDAHEFWSLENFIRHPDAYADVKYGQVAGLRLDHAPKPQPLDLVKSYAALYRRVFG